jgi:hypothetical protein
VGRPSVPPGKSKHEEVRYLDIRKDDQPDEEQLAMDHAGIGAARLDSQVGLN